MTATEQTPQKVQGKHNETLFYADPQLVMAAEQAAKDEKALGLSSTVRLYWKAAMWSVALSVALIMEGYDVGIINSFWGHRAFLERFGSVAPNGTRYIPANWQAALNNAASIGQIIGLTINGFAQPRFGSKKTYLVAMVAMALAIFLPVFSTSLPMLFGGEILCGIPWGVFQTLATAYAAEICPLALRGYLTAFVNMCWGVGLLLAAGVVRASIEIDSQWGWRVPFMLQWIWPVPLFIIACFAPESPWYLVKTSRIEEAKAVSRRLTTESNGTDVRIDQQIALIQHTIALEKAEMEGASFLDCFRGSNLRRTEIVLMVWIIQYWTGQNIVNYATQYLQTGGLNESQAFSMNLGIQAQYIVGTALCWLVMARFGRRAIFIWGIALLGLQQLVVGILGFFNSTAATLGIGSVMVVMNMTTSATFFPVTYTVAAEIPASRVRAKTIVLGRGVYLISSIVCNQITPRMFSEQEWNWGARCGLFWLGFCMLGMTYCYFRLPETKGRLYSELDVLFSNGVPARKFPTTLVDTIGSGDKADEEKGQVEHQEVI
ncbi:hypothetical protein I316_07849 [Kwoniella heveanensis BCC8398]|uniref:Major facilitator superfamily (MFS) profile domain-containing protein n=1 Tax=Kwoniella heveanensis BCC8398 TaxID=1296120 RepID=A0A1B9GHV9_9TREE|nr:hypothetical protein I316_07849 [Kwoniella heveanensis BCC8398]